MSERDEVFKILNDPTYKMLFDKDKFKTPDVYSFEHQGMKIDAIFENSYEEDTRGYICHRLNLAHENSLIGYIKVFYLPKSTFEEMNPDIFHFLNNLKGHSFGLATHPKKLETSDGRNDFWHNKNDEDKQNTLGEIAISLDYGSYNFVCENKDNLTKEDMYERLLKNANSKRSNLKKQFDETIENNIDKPVIEFSKIKDVNDPMNQRYLAKSVMDYCSLKNVTTEEFCNSTETNTTYLRKGLAQKMYTLMADWMALNNLNLYKGGTNELSTPLWEKAMKKNPNIKIVEKDNRVYIDHSKKDLSYLFKEKVKKRKRLKIN
jgi:hypothetical protein